MQMPTSRTVESCLRTVVLGPPHEALELWHAAIVQRLQGRNCILVLLATSEWQVTMTMYLSQRTSVAAQCLTSYRSIWCQARSLTPL